MVKKRLFGRNSWRFSDAGNRFDGPPKPSRLNGQKPISPTLKRGVIHCKRCGSRVVSNTSHCPFCGYSLKPVYARLWFWLLIVVVVAVGVVVFVNMSLPEESTSPSSPAEPEVPQVVGGTEKSSIKNLSLGTTIDNSGLQVTAESIAQETETASGGLVYAVAIEFVNTTEEALILYSTQWMLELSNNVRLDTYVGSAADGSAITSSFEAYELKAGERFVGYLYYAVEQPPALTEEEIAAGVEQAVVTPQLILYQPTALAYNEELLVTWKVPIQAPESEEVPEEA